MRGIIRSLGYAELLGSYSAHTDMEGDMHKILAPLAICVLLIPTSGFAQTEPANNGRGLIIRVPNHESFRLAASPPALRQQHPQERRWRGRHPVLFGALVGLGIGVGVELAVIPGASGGEPHSVYLPMFGATGAGIGSLVGLIVSARR